MEWANLFLFTVVLILRFFETTYAETPWETEISSEIPLLASNPTANRYESSDSLQNSTFQLLHALESNLKAELEKQADAIEKLTGKVEESFKQRAPVESHNNHVSSLEALIDEKLRTVASVLESTIAAEFKKRDLFLTTLSEKMDKIMDKNEALRESTLENKCPTAPSTNHEKNEFYPLLQTLKTQENKLENIANYILGIKNEVEVKHSIMSQKYEALEKTVVDEFEKQEIKFNETSKAISDLSNEIFVTSPKVTKNYEQLENSTLTRFDKVEAKLENLAERIENVSSGIQQMHVNLTDNESERSARVSLQKSTLDRLEVIITDLSEEMRKMSERVFNLPETVDVLGSNLTVEHENQKRTLGNILNNIGKIFSTGDVLTSRIDSLLLSTSRISLNEDSGLEKHFNRTLSVQNSVKDLVDESLASFLDTLSHQTSEISPGMQNLSRVLARFENRTNSILNQTTEQLKMLSVANHSGCSLLPTDGLPTFNLYYVCIKSLTWQNAQEHCEKYRMSLAVVNDHPTFRSLRSALYLYTKQKGIKWFRGWLGGSDIGSEGNWYWVKNRQPITLDAWETGEPNNKHENEHCLDLAQSDSSARFYFYDQTCTAKREFLCELEV